MHKPKGPSKSRAASAADVARLAGVSRSAVSRTFTDGASVSTKTREKVLAAAEELNYHVNHLARGLSQEKSRPVCLLAANLDKPYHNLLLDALTRQLQADGRMVMVINVSADPTSAGEALNRALHYRAAASIVMSGTPPEEMVQSCIKAGQKVILINRHNDLQDVHHIQIDYAQAMQEAVEFFVQAGCQTLTLVSSSKGTPSLVARERFFIRSAQERGLQLTIWRGENTNYEDGQLAATTLLSKPTRDDGYFCITDLVACGFIDTATHEYHVDIPNDLCVLGFDDIPQASWKGYNLTTFAQPYNAIAERVTDILNCDQVDLLDQETIQDGYQKSSQDGNQESNEESSTDTEHQNHTQTEKRDLRSKLQAIPKWRRTVRSTESTLEQ
ncbi:substrate-binding domain-containing protein [Marinomonas mediterranea]|uniref:LacI family DNA-binding transcriptional regulator n=1 Tax=Marinomonas mediterranea TaxID=119864 RepID=UPI00234A96B3|nr:LacI family DNA-binding transcriptional regulator [Marinomonas mediterranea]WCN12740.1 substrate-binding domain-containing protein [Marinomonas mediterranea]